MLPNAAMQAARKVSGALSMITWYMEIKITTAETGTVLPQVQVHHIFKGPEEIGSYRPLGLADPLLSLLSDI